MKRSGKIGKEPIRVAKLSKKYDEETGRYIFDIRFKTAAPLTERTLEVSRSFGLGVDEEKEFTVFRDFQLSLGDDIVYITGDSGSGKSVLLRALREDLGEEAIDIDDAPVDPEKPLIDTVGTTFREALGLLSRVGLNDAHLFLRRYLELSDGQRYRYRIARMIDSGRRFWICDEFCSTLDRTRARIVAYNLQKLARRTGRAAILATTHADLEEDLNPSVVIRKGWGEEVEVEYRPNVEAPGCTATRGITIREADMGDYRKLAYLHYRDHRAPVPLRFFAMERRGDLVGVITYCYSPIRAAGRRTAAGYLPGLEELNRDWATISRVIVHPKYRTIGLGHRLVRETLPLCGRRHVELIAVMARYNPFAERAGMRLIQKSEPHPSVTAAVERLRAVGFNPARMGSRTYDLRRLEELTEDQLDEVREILLGVAAHYYKRLSRTARPYVKRAEFRAWLEAQDRSSLAHSLVNLSILNETKAYLYWCRDWMDEP